MATGRVWYSQIIDGVFLKGLGPRLTPQLRESLRALGLDLRRLQPAYPIELVEQAFALVHRELFPPLTRDEALRALGALSMRGYAETLLGKALVRVMKILGLRRSLLRLNITMASGNNYLETSATIVSEQRIELLLSDVSGMPTFYQGLFEEGGRLLGAPLVITLIPTSAPAQRYRAEW